MNASLYALLALLNTTINLHNKFRRQGKQRIFEYFNISHKPMYQTPLTWHESPGLVPQTPAQTSWLCTSPSMHTLHTSLVITGTFT